MFVGRYFRGFARHRMYVTVKQSYICEEYFFTRFYHYLSRFVTVQNALHLLKHGR